MQKIQQKWKQNQILKISYVMTLQTFIENISSEMIKYCK